MRNQNVWRWTGAFGLLGFLFFAIEFPLWILPGTAPAISDASAHAQYLANIRIIAFTRILLDLGMYMTLMVFNAGLRHAILRANDKYEWLATLVLVSGAVWWAVTLVADSLQGGAVLDTLGGKTDPTAVRTLVEGTLLIFNGSIAFAVTGLFMAAAGVAILATAALPKWIGWFACISALLCVAGVPAMFSNVVDPGGFYNVAGFGPAIIANIPPLLWFLVASIAMIRKREGIGQKSPLQARSEVNEQVFSKPSIS